MKFPRNARIFRGQLDAAPFASVFFLLVIFVMLGSVLQTPGVRVNLPQAANLPGTDRPTIPVALDAHGRFFFEDRVIDRKALESRLREAVTRSSEPLTLLLLADKAVSEENLVGAQLLARSAGIHEVLWATLPPVFTNALSFDGSVIP
jgi:biopolymer transport protein ExbD